MTGTGSTTAFGAGVCWLRTCRRKLLGVLRWLLSVLSVLLTFHLVLVTWVFFRAPDIAPVLPCWP